QTLWSNTIGVFNIAIGYQALFSNVSGIRNTVVGDLALSSLTSGNDNTALGIGALIQSDGVNFNTAVGRRALYRTQGDQNIGLGFLVGSNAGGGSVNNIYIGNVGPVPIGSESNTIRIGTQIPATATIGSPPVESHNFAQRTSTFIAGIYGATTSDAASTIAVVIDANGNL